MSPAHGKKSLLSLHCITDCERPAAGNAGRSAVRFADRSLLIFSVDRITVF